MYQPPNGPQTYAPRPTNPYKPKPGSVQGYKGAAGQHFNNVQLGLRQKSAVDLGRDWTQSQNKFALASQDMNNQSMLEALQLLLTQNANANQRLAAYEKFAPRQAAQPKTQVLTSGGWQDMGGGSEGQIRALRNAPSGNYSAEQVMPDYRVVTYRSPAPTVTARTRG